MGHALLFYFYFYFYFSFYKFKIALCAWSLGIPFAFYAFTSIFCIWLLCMHKSLIIESCDAIVLFELQLHIPTTPRLWSYLCLKFHWHWWQGENFIPAISTWLLLWLEIYSRNHHIIAFVHCTLLGINLVKICGISRSFGLGIFLDSCWNRRKMHCVVTQFWIHQDFLECYFIFIIIYKNPKKIRKSLKFKNIFFSSQLHLSICWYTTLGDDSFFLFII